MNVHLRAKREDKTGKISEATLILGAYLRTHVQLRNNSKMGLRSNWSSSLEIWTKSSLIQLFIDAIQGQLLRFHRRKKYSHSTDLKKLTVIIISNTCNKILLHISRRK